MNPTNKITFAGNATDIMALNGTTAKTGEKPLNSVLDQGGTFKNAIYPPNQSNLDLTLKLIKQNILRAKEQTGPKRALSPEAQSQTKKPRAAKEQITEDSTLSAWAQLALTTRGPEQTGEDNKAVESNIQNRLAPAEQPKGKSRLLLLPQQQLEPLQPKPQEFEGRLGHKGVLKAKERIEGLVNKLSTDGLRNFEFILKLANVHTSTRWLPLTESDKNTLTSLRRALVTNCKSSNITPKEYAQGIGIIEYVQNRLEQNEKPNAKPVEEAELNNANQSNQNTLAAEEQTWNEDASPLMIQQKAQKKGPRITPGTLKAKADLEGLIDQLTIKALQVFDRILVKSKPKIKKLPVEAENIDILRQIRARLTRQSSKGVSPEEYAQKLDLVNYVQNRLNELDETVEDLVEDSNEIN